MESIYDAYKNHRISLEDVYAKCKYELGLNSRDALISACLTLITVRPPTCMHRKYEHISDFFDNEKEYIYNVLYNESPRLASKFTKTFGAQTLIHPVVLAWREQYY